MKEMEMGEDDEEIPEAEFALGLETMSKIAEAIKNKDYSSLPALAECL